MSIAGLLMLSALLLTVVYFVLGLSAYAHVLPEERQKKSTSLVILDPWWPYYDIYSPVVRKTCIAGRLLLPIIVAAYAGWGFLTYGR